MDHANGRGCEAKQAVSDCGLNEHELIMANNCRKFCCLGASLVKSIAIDTDRFLLHLKRLCRTVQQATRTRAATFFIFRWRYCKRESTLVGFFCLCTADLHVLTRFRFSLGLYRKQFRSLLVCSQAANFQPKTVEHTWWFRADIPCKTTSALMYIHLATMDASFRQSARFLPTKRSGILECF